MDVEAAAAITLFAVATYHYLDVQNMKVIRKRWKKRWWMTEIHRNRSRLSMEKQLSELHSKPSGEFKKFTRMSTVDFEYLLQKVSPIISKADTQFRPSITTRIRLAITLRFLASGDSYESLHFLFKYHHSLYQKLYLKYVSKKPWFIY
ncbi:unnamed protein product [Colias eurytheme]|nr:unnamed protein product [Colias eurytheme]